MKDIFISQGKKYISARRASEISDYSSDYIGQLCRAGKLDCTMVGRSWFVTEESLHNHRSEVLQKEIYRNRVANFYGGKKPESSTTYIVERSTTDSVSSPETVSSPAIVDVTAPESSEEVSSPVSYTISYTSDDRPLLPVIDKTSPEAIVTPAVSTISIKRSYPTTASTSEVSAPVVSVISPLQTSAPVASQPTYPAVAHSLFLRRARNVVIIVVVLAGFTTGAWMAFKGPASKLATSSSAPANVLLSIGKFFKESYHEFLTLFGSDTNLAVKTPSSTSGDAMPHGMAVVSSTGSVTGDEALKQKIQSSFSDEVEVKPDQSGTAGVITPVFRATKGADFVYVLVPVKEHGPP